MQVLIKGGVAALRDEHTLVRLLAPASRAESEAIGCEIYFRRVVLLIGQVAAEQTEGVADAGATRNEAGYRGVRDGHISVGGVQCGPLPVAWRAWDGLLEGISSFGGRDVCVERVACRPVCR